MTCPLLVVAAVVAVVVCDGTPIQDAISGMPDQQYQVRQILTLWHIHLYYSSNNNTLYHNNLINNTDHNA
ncbi:MAG TPA: hypothetical protein ENF23_05435 [Methanosarcinales archaeon]|nr:MAG: hypothetical protein DRO03_00875 [Methanosarcinales archaeon]HDN65722.1 hypothetical protein [Methanosarcinales archaeon]